MKEIMKLAPFSQNLKHVSGHNEVISVLENMVGAWDFLLSSIERVKEVKEGEY
jgi:hypothetical protein